MNLTPELITALGIAVATLISSVAALIVSVRSGRISTDNKSKIDEVHVLVDGAQTELKKEIARLSEVIAGLTGKQGDVKNAQVTSDNAKDSVKLSKDMMEKL